MKVHKYKVSPADADSEAAALEEIARYVRARNQLLRLREKWIRIKEDMILPEYRIKAAELRATPRTGRKPAKVRNDHDELRAADSRTLYAEFIASGGSYATWWLVEAASKKAKRPVRDEHAGRAGMLPERLRWDGTLMHYGETSWRLRPNQLGRRPIPEGARIAQAWLQRERTSTALLRKPRYRWYLVVVLDLPTAVRDMSLVARTAAGLDIAWRQDEDSLRVAYVVAETGEHRPIRVPAKTYSRLQHSASLARFADEDANILRTRFGVPANTSHRRLCELAGIDAAHYVEPAEKRVGPPPPVTPDSPSDAIAEHLVHLVDWYTRERTNAIATRDAYYMQEVHELCMEHHTIYVEKIKGTAKLVQKASTRKKKGAGDQAEGGVAREQRQIAAPFTFLRALQREAPKFSTAVVEVPAAFTSRYCARCGTDMGPSSQLTRRCAECGTAWDVDHLAGTNLVRWGPEYVASGEASVESTEPLATE